MRRSTPRNPTTDAKKLHGSGSRGLIAGQTTIPRRNVGKRTGFPCRSGDASASRAIAIRPPLPPRRRAARAGGGALVEQARLRGERAEEPARDLDRFLAALGPRRLRAQLAPTDSLGPALADHAGLPALGEQLASVAALAQLVLGTADHAAA